MYYILYSLGKRKENHKRKNTHVVLYYIFYKSMYK